MYILKSLVKAALHTLKTCLILATKLYAEHESFERGFKFPVMILDKH